MPTLQELDLIVVSTDPKARHKLYATKPGKAIYDETQEEAS